MFKAIGNFFRDVFGTPSKPVLSVPDKIEPPIVQLGPEKIETPPAKCGCGRSPTGLCIGLHKLTAEEWTVHADNPNKVVVEAKAKKPRAKKVAAEVAERPIKKAPVKKDKPVKDSAEKKTRTKKQQ